jgi:two-component system cell cycle response regulator
VGNKPINVLLFEDNPGDVFLVRVALDESKLSSFQVECVKRLSDGLERLMQGGIDIVLLDLALEDSVGIDTFEKVRAQVADIPIVIFTGNNDEALALRTIQDGGQDYITKGQFDSISLSRTILYAIERHRIGMKHKNLSHLDELTGLRNRRGFFDAAEQQIKLAQRTKKDLLVIYADLDGMKQINDAFGHKEGDLALMEAAHVFKMTFRESDIIARLGGDEFAIITVEAGDVNLEIIKERLQKKIDDRHAQGHPLKLSISIGMAHFNHAHPCSVDVLLQEADKMMYVEKRTSN